MKHLVFASLLVLGFAAAVAMGLTGGGAASAKTFHPAFSADAYAETTALKRFNEQAKEATAQPEPVLALMYREVDEVRRVAQQARRGGEVRLAAVAEERLDAKLKAAFGNVMGLIKAHADKVDRGMAVVLRDEKGASKQIFRDGDFIMLEFSGFDRDRYILVDYFLHDGRVFHMWPNENFADNFLPARTKMRLGDPKIGRQSWQIGPPFGDDLVVVIASEQPLYKGQRPMVEDTPDYVKFLQGRLARTAPGAAIGIHHRIVTTVEDEAAAAAVVEERRRREADRLAALKGAAEEQRLAAAKRRVEDELRRAEEQWQEAERRIAEERRKDEERLRVQAGRRGDLFQERRQEVRRQAKYQKLKQQKLAAAKQRLKLERRLAEQRWNDEALRLDEAERLIKERWRAEEQRLAKAERQAEERWLAEERQRKEKARRVAGSDRAVVTVDEFDVSLEAYASGDVAAALEGFATQAQAGSIRAQYMLGRMYSEGEGIAKNPAEGAKWYRLAADRGDAVAQLALAVMYINGVGVPQNVVEAYKWLEVAIAAADAASSVEAVALQDLVEQLMTPAEVKKGRERSDTWRPKP